MTMCATSHVLACPDLPAITRWWRDEMGFELWLEVEGWSFLRRGACGLRIGHCPDAIAPVDLGDHQYFAYVEMDDVDLYHTEIKAKSVDILFPPTDQPWGMREMGVRTPDGHRIMFATILDD